MSAPRPVRVLSGPAVAVPPASAPSGGFGGIGGSRIAAFREATGSAHDLPDVDEYGDDYEYESKPRDGWEALSRTRGERRGPGHVEDIARSRFPFAITWTPIPLITWLVPFVGHMGICDSRGVVYDFAGPYAIGIDGMAFGKPARVLTLDPALTRKDDGRSAVEVWDGGVDAGCDVYCHRMHNLW